MNAMLRRILTVLVLLFAGTLFVGCSGGGNHTPEFVFRYAENQSRYYPTTMGAFYFADLVYIRTGGNVQIHVFYDADLGSENSVISQLQIGGIDFARLSITSFGDALPMFNVLQLPYIFRDEHHMWTVLDGPIGEEFIAATGELGMTGLSWFDAGARSFYTRSEIRVPGDIAGLRVRVQPSALKMEMIESFGARPVPMAFSEVFSALERWEVEAAENNWPSFESALHYQVAPFFLLSEHVRVPELQVISNHALERLPEEYVGIIRQAALESAIFQRREWGLRERDAEERMRESGIKVIYLSPEERRLFEELALPLREVFAYGYMEYVNRIISTGL